MSNVLSYLLSGDREQTVRRKQWSTRHALGYSCRQLRGARNRVTQGVAPACIPAHLLFSNVPRMNLVGMGYFDGTTNTRAYRLRFSISHLTGMQPRTARLPRVVISMAE